MSPPEAWAPKLPQAGRSRDVETPNGGTRVVDVAKDRSRAPKCVGKGVAAPSPLNDEEIALLGPGSSKSELVLIPSSDQELRLAIDTLKKSTTAIEWRTTVLSAQQNHAKLFASSHDAINARKAGHVDRVGQKHAAELQHVKFANVQLFDSLREDVRIEVGRMEKEVKSINVNMSTILNSDDRALAELNELSSSIGSKRESEVDVDALQQRVDKLTHALQHFRAEALKDRLDRTYLEALTTASAPSGAHSTANVVPMAIEEDLSSLYAEIDDMVTMVVAHEHRNALNVALQHMRQSQIREKRTANERIHDALRSLTATLEDASTRLETLKHERYNLHDLQTQILQLEGNIPSRKLSPSIAARVEQEDASTATYALLHHLSLLTAPNKPVESTGFNVHLHDLTTALEQRSLDSVAGILRAAEQAAARGRSALESVSDALAANESYTLAVSALEEGITLAKAGIEAGTTG